MPHRHRAVENVKKIFFPCKRKTLEIRVAPDPGTRDIVMEGKLVERDPSLLVKDEGRVWGIAIAQVGLIAPRRDLETRVSIGA